MNKTTKILIVLALLIFLASPSIAGITIKDQLFQLGNADREYAYKDTTVTCYLGQLFPGEPIYWCMYPDGSMDHSWFVYQSRDMTKYYTTGGTTTTYTVQPKGR